MRSYVCVPILAMNADIIMPTISRSYKCVPVIINAFLCMCSHTGDECGYFHADDIKVVVFIALFSLKQTSYTFGEGMYSMMRCYECLWMFL